MPRALADTEAWPLAHSPSGQWEAVSKPRETEAQKVKAVSQDTGSGLQDATWGQTVLLAQASIYLMTMGFHWFFCFQNVYTFQTLEDPQASNQKGDKVPHISGCIPE